MSQIKILLDVVSDVRHLADSLETYAKALIISEKADEFEEISSAQENPYPDEPAEPAEPAEPVKTYKLTDVRAVLAEISQSGHTAEVKKLLQKYGSKKLSEVNPKDYAKLMEDAEVLKNAG